MVSERDNGLLPLRREYAQVWHGFDRNEVRQYLDHLEAHLRRIMTDRDAAMAQASTLSRELENSRREMTKLGARIEELKKPPERLEDLDERMQRTATLANARAEEITTRAEVAAEKHWAESTEVSTKLRERYQKLIDDLDVQADALHAEHENALKSTRAEVQKLTVEAAQRRETMDAEAERKRRSIEREFETSMAAQRATLEKQIADQHQASKNQAERRIAEATAEAKRRLDEATAEAKRRLDEATTTAAQRTTEATRRVERLAELREQARASLREADEVLKASEAALVPLREESGIAAASKLVGGDEPAPSAAAVAEKKAADADSKAASEMTLQMKAPGIQKPSPTPNGHKPAPEKANSNS
ncbi:cell division protein DivIVA [Amycolatopsis sp.]|jgi:chromosome segregation ATPase|uniref:cell division protein DivIVA n=1 Tax=Amycolatopsis sp. TaxID=37632 RepID=UPI002DFC81B2|nr:cell division protein DivIVA [Amycolatopsis sp.]